MAQLLRNLVFCFISASALVADDPLLQHPSKPLKVIYDTDYNSDCDDAMAYAMLLRAYQEGEIELLGVAASTQHAAQPNAIIATIDATSTWYGLPDIPIARPADDAYDAPDGNYAEPVAAAFPHDIPEDMAGVPYAVDMYKRILREQPDKSVVIISVGMMANLADLLEDPEGRQLLQSKVHHIVQQSGVPHGNDGYNISNDFEPAKYFAENTPVPIWWCSGGREFPSGGTFIESDWNETNNPVYASNYYSHQTGNNRFALRPSWDEAAVFLALHGVRDFDGVTWSLYSGPYDVTLTQLTRYKVRSDNEPNPNGLHHMFVVDKKYKGSIQSTIDDYIVYRVAADFTSEQEGLNLTVDAAPSLGGSLTYTWHWGDGTTTTTTDTRTSHVYKAPGEYSVVLAVTDFKGISDRSEPMTLRVTSGT